MLYSADEVVDSYGAYLDPTYVLIDKEGRIRLRKDGFYYSFSPELSDLILLIQQLINE